ncbi:MAG: restriction endonuclease subunit S [Candidatus Electrothrix sp. AS4_5]|nr:restriction endonuclease subunit S [Candidatus Electrothrix gigas]
MSGVTSSGTVKEYLTVEACSLQAENSVVKESFTTYNHAEIQTIKPYPKYKDSGVEWIGEVPEGWEVKRLKYVAAINEKTLTEKTDKNHHFYYIDIGNVTLGKISFPVEKTSFESAPSRARRLVEDGDTIISTVRTYLKAIANINIDDSDIIVSTGFAVVSPKFDYDKKYFSHLLTCEKIIDKICSLSVGISYPAVNSSDIANIQVWYPVRKEEQTAIAAYLDRKTAEIDKLIANKERLIELYEEEKKAVINQAVTKGLDPDTEMKDSGVEWLGKIPKHWKVTHLKYLIKKLESGVSVNATDHPAIDNDYGVLKTSCVYNYEFTPEENKAVWAEELSRVKVSPRKGEIIISRMNTPELVGASGYVGSDYQNLFLPDRLWQTLFYSHVQIDTYWLSFIFKSSKFRELLSITATGSSSSMKNLAKEDFLNISIPFPLQKEQTAIVQHIETQCSCIDAIISKLKTQIDLFKEYRTALISEAVTGKIQIK